MNGLAVYVTRTGRGEPSVSSSSRSLLAAIAGSPDKNVAAFFITQVQLAGKAEAVKPLAKYLSTRRWPGRPRPPLTDDRRARGGPDPP